MLTTRRFSPPLLAASRQSPSRPVVPVVPVMPVFSTPLHLAICEPPSNKYFAKLSPLLLAHVCRCLSALAATDRPRLHVKNFIAAADLSYVSLTRGLVEINVRSLRHAHAMTPKKTKKMNVWIRVKLCSSTSVGIQLASLYRKRHRTLLFQRIAVPLLCPTPPLPMKTLIPSKIFMIQPLHSPPLGHLLTVNWKAFR